MSGLKHERKRFTEIDGERIVVYWCEDCPFYSSDRTSFCGHPARSKAVHITGRPNVDPFKRVDEWHHRERRNVNKRGFKCPLREVE